MKNNASTKRATKPLTKKQASILAFIKAWIDKKGYPPTRRDIADEFGLAINGITQHLGFIEKKGAIKCIRGVARGLVIL